MFNEVHAKYARDSGILAGPHRAEFDVEIPVCVKYGGESSAIRFEIEIDQIGIRKITIKADQPVYWSRLLTPLYELERLLAIFDGSFVPIKDICFMRSGDPARGGEDDCAAAREHALKQRLKYFSSSDWSASMKGLVDFWDVLTPELFEQWRCLVDELDIANQVYLYVLSDNGMPKDLLLAFMVELAEPLVEVVNLKCERYPSLKPGERGTSLKQCLNALVNDYGRVIFRKEIEEGYAGFLSKLVASRVRVMHIKRNQEKGILDGRVCAFYLMKLSLLYRVVLLDLLGIPEASYEQRLEQEAKRLDDWAAANG